MNRGGSFNSNGRGNYRQPNQQWKPQSQRGIGSRGRGAGYQRGRARNGRGGPRQRGNQNSTRREYITSEQVGCPPNTCLFCGGDHSFKSEICKYHSMMERPNSFPCSSCKQGGHWQSMCLNRKFNRNRRVEDEEKGAQEYYDENYDEEDEWVDMEEDYFEENEDEERDNYYEEETKN
jgi:hypothetical protein